GWLLSGSGCDTLSNDDPDDAGSGTFSVLLTDAPFPSNLLKNAFIYVDSLDVRQKGSETDTGAYITLSTTPAIYDLMDLRNGVTATLAELDIPGGTYSQVRLFVDSAKVVLIDSSEFPLKVPSGASTGLKVFIRPDIIVEEGITSELLLDFDISKSFVARGSLDGPKGITGFNLKPVIRAVNLATAGRLRGTVVDTSDTGIPDVQLSISSGDSVLTNTFTDTTGAYALLGIPVGTYTVEAEAAGYLTETVTDVAVDEQGTTVQNFTLLPE
ncbi:DUF4382 domain-containing protein, partial [Candidatus Neomarinimicrobiota bacterium]